MDSIGKFYIVFWGLVATVALTVIFAVAITYNLRSPQQRALATCIHSGNSTPSDLAREVCAREIFGKGTQ